MKNPYLVRLVYLVCGIVIGTMISGCGGSSTPATSGARIEITFNQQGQAIFTCVDYVDTQECIDLLRGNDGAVGAMGPQGPVGPEGSAGPVGPAGEDGIDGTDGEDGQDCIQKEDFCDRHPDHHKCL